MNRKFYILADSHSLCVINWSVGLSNTLLNLMKWSVIYDQPQKFSLLQFLIKMFKPQGVLVD